MKKTPVALTQKNQFSTQRKKFVLLTKKTRFSTQRKIFLYFPKKISSNKKKRPQHPGTLN